MKSISIIILSLCLLSCGELGSLSPSMFNTSQKATDQSTSQLQADAQINLTNGDSKSEKYRNSNITKEETNTTKKDSFWTGIGSFFHLGSDKSNKTYKNGVESKYGDNTRITNMPLSSEIINFIDNYTFIIVTIFCVYFGWWLNSKKIKKIKKMNKMNKEKNE